MAFMRNNNAKPHDIKKSIKKLLSFLQPFMAKLILVFILSAIANALGLFVPKILGHVTNDLAGAVMSQANGAVVIWAPVLSGITVTLGLLLGLYALSMIFSYIQGITMIGVTTQITYNLRNSIIDKINKLPLGFFNSMTHGEVLSRLTNDVDTLGQNLTSTVTQIINTVITLVVVLWMMITISWQLTLIALLMIPGSVLVTLFMVKVSQKYFRAQQKLLGTVNGVVEEIFSGHTVIKAFNGEERVLRDFDEQNNALYNTAWKAQFLTGLMMPMMNFVGNLGYVAICMYGAYLSSQGKLGIGEIQAFITYIRSFTQPITQLANISSQIQSIAAAAERIFEFLEADEEQDVDTLFNVQDNPIEGDVTFEHVNFAYEYKEKDEDDEDDMFAQMKKKMEEMEAKKGKKGKKGGMPDFPPPGGGFPGEKKKVKKLAGAEDEDAEPKKKKSGETVIHDFSATVKAGQKVAIVGPTGAGKTTMVKLLMRFHDIQGGKILIDGKDIARYKRRDIRSEFGMVLQDTWLYNGSIMENIRYGKLGATDEEVIAAAKAAQVDHFVRTLPESYNLVLNEETTNISQGQKQLLTIARAILANAKILILDEATSSVDTRTEILIQRAMDNLLEGRTSFIIAHRLSTIRNADLILCMKDGDIVEQGTHDELMEKGGFYAQLYNSQFENAA
jgi:ATP-binding cassette subfamily B protein